MSISKFASKVNTSKIILKSSKSYTEYNNLYFPNNSIYSDPNFKNVYPSVTRIVALLSEGCIPCLSCHHLLVFSAWNQKIVLDSFVNQIVYLGKRQVLPGFCNYVAKENSIRVRSSIFKKNCRISSQKW